MYGFMHRLLAVTLVGLLGLTAPALAQTSAPANQGAPQATSDGRNLPATSGDGQDAFAQAPPGPQLSPLLIGGIVLGATGLIVLVATQSKDDTPTSP